MWICQTHQCKQLAQAPAKQVGKIARAFQAEQLGVASASVEAACRVHESHGERDAHRTFRRYGLSLQVPISSLTIQSENGPVSLPHLKITDFCKVLLQKYPKLLLAGWDIGTAEADLLLETFWSRFQLFQADHAVFANFGREEWRDIVPLMLHGDKGRGFSKKPVMCFSFEAAFGLPDSLRCAGTGACLHSRVSKGRQVHGGRLSVPCKQREREQCPDLEEAPTAGLDCPFEAHSTCKDHVAMPHSGKGHTFLSRFLITAIPHRILQGCPDMIWAVLKECADNLTTLFKDGLQVKGRTMRIALIGCKGDYEFHHEAAEFNRCYARVGTVNSWGMCPECDAGTAQFPFTDMADVPMWTSTLYATVPWSTQPPLNSVPFSGSKPASLYRRDMFHTLKFGILKDLAACVLIQLAWFGMFDDQQPETRQSKALEPRLNRGFGYFKLWCIANGKSPTLRKFSLGTLHRKQRTHMPFLGGKGSDAILVLMFLAFFLPLRRPQVQGPAETLSLLQAMEETIRGALDFVGIHHGHDMFLNPYCAGVLYSSGLCLLRGYCFLADHAMRERLNLYSLRPKLHYFAHTLWEVRTQLAAGHCHILNPCIFGCEQNEDWIGRISRLSRKVSPRLCTQRTIDRYLIGVKLLLKKHGL